MTADASDTMLMPSAAPEEMGAAPVLSEQVRMALRSYFVRLDGHDATDLYAMVMSEVEKPLIETVLEQCGHNQSRAALVLGLSRSTLRKKMGQHGIE